MAIIKSIPSRKIIGGQVIQTSELSVVSELDYRTNGEFCIIVKGILESFLVLDSKTTDHVVIKALTKVTVRPDFGRIDEEWDELVLDKFACVEFQYVSGNWYILSSDGLKQS
jgi:hypothetical protein